MGRCCRACLCERCTRKDAASDSPRDKPKEMPKSMWARMHVKGKVIENPPEDTPQKDMLRLAGASGDQPQAALPSSPTASAATVAQQPDGQLSLAQSPDPQPGEGLPELPDGTLSLEQS